MTHRIRAAKACERRLQIVLTLLASAVVLSCNTDRPTASPGEPHPTTGPTQQPTAPQSDPGPKPTALYPDDDAIGLGQLNISTPSQPSVRFWLTCEWSSGERVQWLYTGGGTAGYPGGPITLFGEPVIFYVSNLLDDAGSPYSVSINRFGDAAPYRVDPTGIATLSHNEDWTTGTLRFEHLRLDASAGDQSPAPSRSADFTRPLGGDENAFDLSGSFEWQCDPRPTTAAREPG